MASRLYAEVAWIRYEVGDSRTLDQLIEWSVNVCWDSDIGNENRLLAKSDEGYKSGCLDGRAPLSFTVPSLCGG